MARIIALIRGINVGSTRKAPMAELRGACAEIGLGTVQTYIQSGNLLLEGGDPAAIEATLEDLIRDRFGHDISVVARTAAQWIALIAACPFQAQAKAEPKRALLLVSKKPAIANASEALLERARHGELIAPCGDGVLIYFTHERGQADTKLSPSLIDLLIGSPTTGRNWNTVLTLAAMAAA